MKTRTGAILAGILVIACVLPEPCLGNELESWYTYWGGGFAQNTYPDELEETLDLLEDTAGVDHFAMGLDILGFYWPRDEQTLWGGVISGSIDTYEVAGFEADISNYLYAFSAMRFLTNRIGQGPFVRADVGFARHAGDVKTTGSELSTTSDWGTGLLLGAGYGIPVTEGTRILLNGSYAIKRVEGDVTETVRISVGGLF